MIIYRQFFTVRTYYVVQTYIRVLASTMKNQFWQVLWRMTYELIWCHEHIFRHNLRPSWILSPSVMSKQFLTNVIVYVFLNLYLDANFVNLWQLEFLFLTFRHFFFLCVWGTSWKRTFWPCSPGICSWHFFHYVIKWKHFSRNWPFLCGQFTGHRWIPLTKAGDAELWCCLWSGPE